MNDPVEKVLTEIEKLRSMIASEINSLPTPDPIKGVLGRLDSELGHLASETRSIVRHLSPVKAVEEILKR